MINLSVGALDIAKISQLRSRVLVVARRSGCRCNAGVMAHEARHALLLYMLCTTDQV